MTKSIIALLLVACLPGEAILACQWYFLPTFHESVRGVEAETVGDGEFFTALPTSASGLLAEGSPLTEAQRKEVHWRPASFPHRDFVSLMPKNKVFGWYGCLLDVPPELAGQDLLLDLGIIDDADETYLNGSRIGGMGTVPGGSAWQSDRLYRISAEQVKPQRNYIAVHVWSLWGLGGIVGPPVVTAALAPADARWELAFMLKVHADSLNSAKTLAEALAPLSSVSSLECKSAPLPWNGYASWPKEAHFAVFKLPFDLKTADGAPMRFARPVVIDMGAVFDVAAFYLNGVRVGRTGRFPEKDEPAFTETAQRARFIVEKTLWRKDGRNELVAVVYRERGVGGLPGIPGILLENPAEMKSDATFAQVLEAFVVCLQSDQLSNAAQHLKKAKPQSDGERVWLLSHKAHLAYLEWRDGKRRNAELLDDVLSPLAEIVSSYPTEAPRQSAMQAFCRVLRMADNDSTIRARVLRHFPSYAKGCKALPPDRATRGDWPLFYGNRQYILCAYGKAADWIHSGGIPLPYSLSTTDANDNARCWQPLAKRQASDAAALVIPATKFPLVWRKADWVREYWLKGTLFQSQNVRRAAWWDDHGEMHPFDDGGPDLLVQLPSGMRPGEMLSLYLCDLDWRRSRHPRQQSILAFDASGRFLNACWSGKSDTGVYERFLLELEGGLALRVCKHRGACVALSGLFWDATPVFSSDILSPFTSRRDLDITPFSPQGMHLRLGRLPPGTRPLFRLALEAEREFRAQEAVGEYRKGLATLDTHQEVLALWEAFAKVASLHPVWQTLLLARMDELLKELPPEEQKVARRLAGRTCGFNPHVPLLGLLNDMEVPDLSGTFLGE